MKSGFISIIGRPNVGKSTLTNKIIGEKIAITSNKPQTTRYTINGVYNDDRGQLVFVDTPGIHRAANKLAKYMNKDALKSIKDVDVVLYLVEPSDYIGKGEEFILSALREIDVPVILLINKIDTVKTEAILPIIAAFKDKYDFKSIIPISAFKGEQVDEVVDAIFDIVDEGPMYYDRDAITNQSVKSIVSEMIREKILHNMKDEIPHGIYVEIEKYKKRENKDLVDIDAVIVVEKDSHKGMVIGKGGSMLKRIGSSARRDIEELISSKVNLKIFVKVKKNWRDDDYLLKDYGFKKE